MRKSGEMIALSVTHRNTVVTKGLSRRKQATNVLQFTSIDGFWNDRGIISATKERAKSGPINTQWVSHSLGWDQG